MHEFIFQWSKCHSWNICVSNKFGYQFSMSSSLTQTPKTNQTSEKILTCFTVPLRRAAGCILSSTEQAAKDPETLLADSHLTSLRFSDSWGPSGGGNAGPPAALWATTAGAEQTASCCTDGKKRYHENPTYSHCSKSDKLFLPPCTMHV